MNRIRESQLSIESAFVEIASITHHICENINRHDEIEENYASGSEMDIYSINVIGIKKLS